MARVNIKKNKIQVKEQSSFPFFKVFFTLISVLSGVSSYYMLQVLSTPPDMPKMNLDHYWGTYPLEAKQDLSIRPFEIEFSDVIVNDLRERLLHRRPFTPPLEDAGFSYGFNTAFLTKVLDYWQNKYNFKEREAFFNKYEHFMTNIQGLDIHYMHVKPTVTEDITVVPLLLLHGWPGSIREFYEIIPMLTKTRPEYNIVFEIIAPSLPGFGFSQGAARPGLGSAESAVIIHNLMKRIGISKYYIQGGDAGHAIGSIMATLFPEEVLGFHTNFPVVDHPLAALCTIIGSFWPSFVESDPKLQSRMYPLGSRMSWLLEESGYMHLHATKPDTIGAALTESPAGLAAYILEKFSTWTNPEFKQAVDGELLKKFSLTHLLDNVMVYWVTNSITTSVRLYSETLNKREFGRKWAQIPTEVPTCGIKFKHELLYQPDFLLKLKYKNYLQSTISEEGGHFAAFENPAIMAEDIFGAVETFREFHRGKRSNEPDTSSKPEPPKTIYDFTVTAISGDDVKLDKYKGNVVIIVNVASECGLTDKNYKQLNDLYEKYSISKGLRILAFPCNQFNSQEPGTLKDILKFTQNLGVKFDLFEKVEVNGDDVHPLWKFLKNSQGGTLGDFIKWNFSKFIIDRNGFPVERLGPNVDPVDLEPYLAKYW